MNWGTRVCVLCEGEELTVLGECTSDSVCFIKDKMMYQVHASNLLSSMKALGTGTHFQPTIWGGPWFFWQAGVITHQVHWRIWSCWRQRIQWSQHQIELWSPMISGMVMKQIWKYTLGLEALLDISMMLTDIDVQMLILLPAGFKWVLEHFYRRTHG